MAVGLWICCRKKAIKATKIVTVDEKGEEFMERVLILSEGPKRFQNIPKDDQGVVDETIEDLRRGYDSAESGATTAEDGSSSIVSDGLFYTVTPLAPSPIVDGVLQFSEVESDLDPDTTPGAPPIRIATRDRFAVVDSDTVIATTIETQEVAL